MNLLRPATQEEVATVAANSDLDETCQVIALDTPKGPILAVRRVAIELDPVHMPEGFSPRHFHNFLRDAANYLLGQGATHYYFNLHAEDKDYLEAMTDETCFPVSTKPDIRFRKNLLRSIKAPNNADENN
jgi:hypothetical protein